MSAAAKLVGFALLVGVPIAVLARRAKASEADDDDERDTEPSAEDVIAAKPGGTAVRVDGDGPPEVVIDDPIDAESEDDDEPGPEVEVTTGVVADATSPGQPTSVPRIKPTVLPDDDDEGSPAPTAAAPPSGAEPPSLDKAEQSEEIPFDTAHLVKNLLDVEGTSGWKTKHKGEVKAWQKSRGITADGLAGPKTMQTIAVETGLVPIVRYWPRNSQKSQAVPEYQAALISIANTAPEPRRSQLYAASEREKGQGYGPDDPVGALIQMDVEPPAVPGNVASNFV